MIPIGRNGGGGCATLIVFGALPPYASIVMIAGLGYVGVGEEMCE